MATGFKLERPFEPPVQAGNGKPGASNEFVIRETGQPHQPDEEKQMEAFTALLFFIGFSLALAVVVFYTMTHHRLLWG